MTKSYRVKLRKIKSNHQNLRTDVIEGSCSMLPFPGMPFYMTGPGLVFGTRHVTTSLVKSVAHKEHEIDFETENSSYKLLIVGESNEE